MMAIAGHPLGLNFRFLDPSPDACAFALGEACVGAFDDPQCLEALVDGSDLLTYEFENVSLEKVSAAAQRVPLHPPIEALSTKQDRLLEKRLFESLEIPTSPFGNIESEADLDSVAKTVSFPLVMKARSLGYDGKGQRVVKHAEDLAGTWEELGRIPVIVEQFIEFEREVSMIVARGRNGETASYPLSENVHEEAILRSATCRPNDPMTNLALEYAGRLLEHLEFVGVLALELFQRGDELIANEYAPRVHNSGHWTIEGAETSQFENHLRAILGLPLGSTAPVGHVTMLNCIGEIPDLDSILDIPGVHPHIYGKEPRLKRKIGHITVRADSAEQLQQRLDLVRERTSL